MFTDFLHRLFNPHCELCTLKDREDAERAEAAKICSSCSFLKTELAKERNRSQQLMDAVLEAQRVNSQIAEERPAGAPPEAISPFIPWRVQQRRLEEESRKKAEILKAKSTEELEKELLEGVEK